VFSVIRLPELSAHWGQASVADANTKSPTLEMVEQRLVRAGKEGLELERRQFVGQRSPPGQVEMRCDFVE